MQEKILIIDFGSQYTQLIARRVRELNVYCEIHPFHHLPSLDKSIKGVIFSGSPFSVKDTDAPQVNYIFLEEMYPILGICYGAQYIAQHSGGCVVPSAVREYGRAKLQILKTDDPLFEGISNSSDVWMSHGDAITEVPIHFEVLAKTNAAEIAAYHIQGTRSYGIQFHPEVTHTQQGQKLLQNFLTRICACSPSWTPSAFIDNTVATLRRQIGDEKVVLGLSGGVDSSVAAMLLHHAISKNLHCIFVNNGLLRKDEYENVLKSYQHMGLQIQGIDATDLFLNRLAGVKDPEKKRKIIGHAFIEVFEKAAHEIKDVKWLGQGTIYPDIIESATVQGPSATIKSHHNVGGLPEEMNLKVVEPLNTLFKDEVRKVGKALGVDNALLRRHPFPGPGLAVRILDDVTSEKLAILQEADAIFINYLEKSGWYDQVWQAGAIFLPVQSVGVMGDGRTYEHVICLRAVNSVDGMTADWAQLPYDLLAAISNDIINQVKGINRVVYDISSKPPATIEWE